MDWASDKVQRGRAAAGLGNVPPPRRPNITGRDARQTRRRGRPRYTLSLALAEGGRLKIRADVLADAGLDFDVETGFGGDFKGLAVGVCLESSLAIQLDGALAGDDFHALGLVGAEMEFAGEDEAEGFSGAIGQQNGVADDLAVEIDVGLGDSGDVAKFSGYGWHIGGSVGEGIW